MLCVRKEGPCVVDLMGMWDVKEDLIEGNEMGDAGLNV